jgi:hypothetical protein
MKVKEGELATGDEAASHADSLGAFPRASQPPQRPNTPGPMPCALQRCGMAPRRTRSFSVDPVKANPNSNEPGLMVKQDDYRRHATDLASRLLARASSIEIVEIECPNED